MNLRDKIVVITGGSQGFGKALANAFFDEGSKVIITSQDKEKLENTAKELSCNYFFADITSRDEVKKISEYVLEKYPSDFDDYMKVEYAVEKVMANLKSENPEIDLIIKRPIK